MPPFPGPAVVIALLSQIASGGAPGSPHFVDVSERVGLHFSHDNGMTGEYYFPEMTGQGGALFDYDADGDLDAYLVQGGELRASAAGGGAAGRLLRNDARSGANRGLLPRWVDVTEQSGIRAQGYGMGAAVGDVDGDGWPDLYLTHYGPNQLFRNRGDGTFEDWTAGSGTADPSWSTSATFADLDGDGDEDLFVVNYVAFDLQENPRCYAASSRLDYCGPSGFSGQPDRLYRNLGGGRFEDATSRLLLEARAAPGLGVVAADLSGDGRVDLYVANDGEANQLWIQRPDGSYTDDALFSGAAVNREGRAEAGMGIAVGDFDEDGDEDLFVTHLSGETHTLYVNQGRGLFLDRTREYGLASPTLPYTGFGVGWVDVDGDGRQDLAVMNGAVRIDERQAAAGDPFPLKQPNSLFLSTEEGFVEVADGEAAGVFRHAEVSRGAAFGDVDNDGDVDILQLNNNGPARLLANARASEAGWVGLTGLASSSRVEVVREDGARLHRRSHADGSYCVANDPRVQVGLGASAVARVEVESPAGRRTRWLKPPADAYLRVPLAARGKTGEER